MPRLYGRILTLQHGGNDVLTDFPTIRLRHN